MWQIKYSAEPYGCMHLSMLFVCTSQEQLQTVQPFYTKKEPGRFMLAAHMQCLGGPQNRTLTVLVRLYLYLSGYRFIVSWKSSLDVSHLTTSILVNRRNTKNELVFFFLGSPPAIERLSGGLFQEVIVTNTIPVKEQNYFPQLTVLSVANLLGETIWRVYDDSSVIGMFH